MRTNIENKVTFPYNIRFWDIEPALTEEVADSVYPLMDTIKVFITVVTYPANPDVGIMDSYSEIVDWDRSRYDENLSLFESEIDDAISDYLYDNDEIFQSKEFEKAVDLDNSYQEGMRVDEYIERNQMA